MQEIQSEATTNHALSTTTLRIILIVSASLPLFLWCASDWHDQQRVSQIIVFTLCFLSSTYLLTNEPVASPLIGSIPRWCLAALLLSGVASALLARHILWALAEVSLVVSSIALCRFFASIRRENGKSLDETLINTIYIVITSILVLYFVIYQQMLSKELSPFSAYKTLWGFSNPRFFGQFLALTLPMMIFPLLREGASRNEVVAVSILSALWWAAAITSASRGLALAMVAAGVWLSLTGSTGRRWSILQLRFSAIGLLIYLVLFSAIPAWLDIDIKAHVSERLTTSLSMREVIWKQAIDMMMERPWLGFGPMHFADHYNAVATHPHQALLQWASEWGIPSAIAVTALVFLAARNTYRLLSATADSRTSPDTLRVCLSGSIAATLTLSMVDGVLVMPTTQLWLAILGGWLLGLNPAASPPGSPAPIFRGTWILVQALAMMLLLSIVFRDLPGLAANNARYVDNTHEPLQPRFWLQGVIADLDKVLTAPENQLRQKQQEQASRK
ncbi:O-antigen ligase family protein [Pseudomonas sp. GCM10022186]|uniref:O-antigen ligase family protein n=1 Tax=Pseudomonas sp. GCM10022186 TaxID=3252650 RepID=UPI00361EF69F